jgi:hypothetical protein
MYKANRKHLQPPLISNVQELPDKHRQRLEQSWAGEFYRGFFCRLKEQPFACMYADHPSRPNIPVNILVALDVLKAGFGWSDEELHDHYTFDVQVRYALGYHNLSEGDFDLRTMYNFRNRLSQYNLEHGINLLEQCFEDITDQQVSVFKVQTNQQRMDSTMIASNILDSSRLQLAAELLQRIERLLSETDRGRYAEMLAPYLKDTVNQYVYRIKGKEQVQEQLIQIGQILYALLNTLRADYAHHPFLSVVERFFAENFQVEETKVQPKDGKELSSGCLQSLDDLEASYRQKGQRFYKGYVANVTETCNPDNPVQLITKVQAASNNVDDPALLIAALPNLAQRTGLEQLYTDGGYGSPDADQALRQHQVAQIQTAIRGTRLNPDKLHLSSYVIEQNEQGEPIQITCPQGYTAVVHATPSHRSFLARFDPGGCTKCPFHSKNCCRILWRKRCAKFQMDFTLHEVDAAVRRRRCLENQQSEKNLRAAIEAAMRSLKHPFPAGKLPVRGLFRVCCLLIGSAAMINIRRITRFHLLQNRSEGDDLSPIPSAWRSLSSLRTLLCGSLAWISPHWALLGC